ncbi:MAG TPA: hypothetical protein ENI80_08615 [Acidiferrobacteraceae bacterium]|nr:hypothetical protein [Acidiferrobacteraceae bacterium]
MSSTDHERDERIRVTLRALRVRHPQLADLADLVPDTLEITSSFLEAYFNSSAPKAKRALLLRALLSDEYVLQRRYPVTNKLLTRIAQYFSRHPTKHFDHYDASLIAEDIPRHLESLLGIAISTPQQFLDRWAVSRYMSNPERYEYLKCFWQPRILTPTRASKMFEGEVTWSEYDYYFDISNSELRWHNILSFCLAYIRHDHLNGGLRYKFPRKVTDAIGVDRLSIPQILVFMDVFTLAKEGLLKLNEADDTPVSRLIRQCYDTVSNATVMAQWYEALFYYIVPFALLTPVRSELLLRQKQMGGRVTGICAPGLFFNSARMIDNPIFDGYRLCYDAVDHEKMFQTTVRHYAKHDRDFAFQLSKTAKIQIKEQAGVKIRDLANSLFYAHHLQHRHISTSRLN